MKALFDTNVWLDIVLSRDDFLEYSAGSIMVALSEDVEVCMASTSLKDVFYLAEKSISADYAYAAIGEIQTYTTILPVDAKVCSDAMNLERPDYEDGIIAGAALIEGVDAIVSRDKNAFNDLPIQKYSPVEFIDAMGYEEVNLSEL